MSALLDAGWKKDEDVSIRWESYTKEVHGYKICVSRHVEGEKWAVALIDFDMEQITVNEDATIEWVLDLVEILSSAQMYFDE